MQYRINTPQTKLRKGVAVGLFLLTLLLILLLYPNIKNFRYSYQAGKPWQYETLYAPFHFPVKKSAQQLTREREKLRARLKPYYDFKNTVGVQQIARAQKDGKLSPQTLSLLKSIYSQPILPTDTLVGNSTTGYVVKNHISTEMEMGDFKTLNNVTRFIQEQNITQSQKEILLSYVKPNLLYNEQQTEAFNNMDNISEFSGEVQANELIVSRGEIVTKQTYVILESLKNEYANKVATSSNISMLLLGQFLFVFICLFFLYLFLRSYRESVLYNPLFIIFILLGIITSVAITRFLLDFNRFEIWLVPYILIAIIIRTFIDTRTAIFVFLATMLICSFIVPQGHQFLVMQVITGIIAVLFLRRLDRRSQLLFIALVVFVSYSMVYIALYTTMEEKLSTINTMVFARLFLNSIFLTIAYPLLYILEKTFGFLSNVTLMELSNTNNKLLRRLSQEAPGTFHHSLQVANLAEGAVREIGGNPLLVRTGALYHDIGKMKNPLYFTENQHGEISPHKELSYEESAKIIIGHVTEGVKMAKKYNLPYYLIDFISTHHGKGYTEYFYRSEMNENPDKEVDKADYAYPGPDPFTLEQAVLMMADSCEAATRSLKKKSEQNISEMVTKIIDSQKMQGRFNNAPITMQNIERTKELFIEKLTNIYHSRIAYPEKKKEKNA